MYIYIYMYTYISIYIGLTRPLQDIVLHRGCCARINHPVIALLHLHCPHYCITIARLLCITIPPNDPLFVWHTPYNIGDGNIV